MMRGLCRSGFALCATALLLAPVQAGQPTTITAQPGDVVRVDGAATAFGKTWKDLIGIDLTTKPGSYPVNLGTTGASTAATILNVQPKEFPVRKLTVPPDFVTPPPAALTQIAEDNKRTAAIWRRVTPRKWQGTFLLPVDGQPTSSFGTRSFFNGQPRSPHTGVDFPSPQGTAIRAANHGIVVLAAPLYFTGNTLIIDYGDGLYSMYAHLSEFRAREGDVVTPEMVVGLVGATGRVTGPHLHWGVRLQGANVDGLSLIRATR
jgi:murein DD-endopeptidase MepM/ murein hydrolase activator NlpD